MASNRISISITAAASAGDAVQLEDFLGELDAAKHALIELDKQKSGTGKRTLTYNIVKLSYASPATVVLEAVPLRYRKGNPAAVVGSYISGMKAIKAGHIPEELGQDVVLALRRIGKQASRRIGEVVYSSNGESVQVTKGLDAMIEAILGPDEVVQGSMTGMLEMINIHNDANRFTIYPPAGPSRVDCRFRAAQTAKAIQGVGHNVCVKGQLRYKARDRFPYAVDVEDVEIYPPDNELPTLSDLRGAAPDITGNLTVEEFIERLRGDK
ncbi:MAG: hypothetical protein NTX53_03250 [candidate division WOR-3 bacterium]|nr:hypothetical protein [candidate division WOR-3 bacterium]